MSPSLNSTLVTNPPTRALTCPSSIASKRPVNSSQSVTVRLVGCATVTGGAPAACCGGFSPQPDSVTASRTISGLKTRREWGVESAPGATRTDLPLLLTSCSPALAAPIRLVPSLCKNRARSRKFGRRQARAAHAAVRADNFRLRHQYPVAHLARAGFLAGLSADPREDASHRFSSIFINDDNQKT